MLVLRDYQRAAIDAVYQYLREDDGNPCIVLPTGCHEKGHPILMHDGTIKNVEDITPGDKVMGPDSAARTVVSLCRGVDDLYRISPIKGESFVVNGDHILHLVCTNEGKGGFACQKNGGEIDHITVKDYLSKSKYWKHLRKLKKSEPISFPSPSEFRIDPYIIGAMLGDGSFSGGSATVQIHSQDDEVVDAFRDFANSIDADIVEKSQPSGRCPSYNFRQRYRRKDSYVVGVFLAAGLERNACEEKKIPHRYMVSSINDRMQLLAGLMDTDGSLSRCGYDFISKSRELADGVVFVSRSVGLSANVAECTKSSQNGTSGQYFRVSITGDTSKIPCKVGRKKAGCRNQKKNPLRTGFKVEKLERGSFFGFTLDGDHLYLDGNFFIHHNSGKTPTLATICKDAVVTWANWDSRVLILAHVKELLQQAANTLQNIDADLFGKVGVYSAGLKSRDTHHSIIVAGIQSVYKKACDLGKFDLIIIDEAHLIPPDGDGMYQQFLSDARVINPDVRVIGLTATPYRMKSGMIVGGDSILTDICYEVGVKDLVEAGYLSPLRSKAGLMQADLSEVHVRAGEFIASELEALMDSDALVESACAEILEYTKNRKSCLIFASGVAHAKHVAEVLRDSGHRAECIFGSTPADTRARLISEFRAGLIPYMVNVNVLAVGFDAPNVDTIAMMRPTKSPGLFYQQVGRGFRLTADIRGLETAEERRVAIAASGKPDCLVLDFAQNIATHGPVDQIKVGEVRQGTGEGETPVKTCPECQEILHAALRQCPACGFEFPKPEVKHEPKASLAGILSGEITTEEVIVMEVSYAAHTKKDADDDHPKTLRVDYHVAGERWPISEWVCIEHEGWARRKAESWWRKRSAAPCPRSAAEAAAIGGEGGIADVSAITVKRVVGKKFPEIVGHSLREIPEWHHSEAYYDAEQGRLVEVPTGISMEVQDDDLPF